MSYRQSVTSVSVSGKCGCFGVGHQTFENSLVIGNLYIHVS